MGDEAADMQADPTTDELRLPPEVLYLETRGDTREDAIAEVEAGLLRVIEDTVTRVQCRAWAGYPRPRVTWAAGEGVALAAPVLKPMKGHGRLNAKMLIWTSRRRLVYVDAATLKLKECEPRVEAVGGASFMRVFQGKGMRVQCVIHPPTKWEAAIGGRRSTM